MFGSGPVFRVFRVLAAVKAVGAVELLQPPLLRVGHNIGPVLYIEPLLCAAGTHDGVTQLVFGRHSLCGCGAVAGGSRADVFGAATSQQACQGKAAYSGSNRKVAGERAAHALQYNPGSGIRQGAYRSHVLRRQQRWRPGGRFLALAFIIKNCFFVGCSTSAERLRPQPPKHCKIKMLCHAAVQMLRCPMACLVTSACHAENIGL